MIGVDLMFNGDALIVMGIRLKMRYNYIIIMHLICGSICNDFLIQLKFQICIT